MIPTARGDDAEYVAKFHAAFGELGATTQHLPLFHRTPDLRSLILAQDAIFVGGGNTKSMLAVWRDWGLPETAQRSLRIGHRPGRAERRARSAGSNRESPIRGPIGCGRSTAWDLLPGSCCPHYDGEVERRPAYHALVQSGDIKPGYAIEDAVAAHFRDGRLERVVSKKAGAKAYYVSVEAGAIQEAPLEVTLLPPR